MSHLCLSSTGTTIFVSMPRVYLWIHWGEMPIKIFNRNIHNSRKLSVQMLLLRTMQAEALLGASISKKYNLPLVVSMLQVLRLQNLHTFNSRRLLKRILLARSFDADFPKDIVTVLKWSLPLKMPQTQLLMSFYSFCFYLYLINPYMPKIEWVPCFFSFSFPKNY